MDDPASLGKNCVRYMPTLEFSTFNHIELNLHLNVLQHHEHDEHFPLHYESDAKGTEPPPSEHAHLKSAPKPCDTRARNYIVTHLYIYRLSCSLGLPPNWLQPLPHPRWHQTPNRPQYPGCVLPHVAEHVVPQPALLDGPPEQQRR
jgi:hypothetical protein